VLAPTFIGKVYRVLVEPVIVEEPSGFEDRRDFIARVVHHAAGKQRLVTDTHFGEIVERVLLGERTAAIFNGGTPEDREVADAPGGKGLDFGVGELAAEVVLRCRLAVAKRRVHVLVAVAMPPARPNKQD